MDSLQSATRQDLLQITTGITKCDDYNKMRCQYTSFWSWMLWVHYQTNMFKISGRQKSFNELCIKARALIQLRFFLSTHRSKWVVRNIGNNKNRSTWESPAHVPFLVYEEYYASYCMWSWWVTAALLQVIIFILFSFFPETWYEWKGKNEGFLCDFNNRC